MEKEQEKNNELIDQYYCVFDWYEGKIELNGKYNLLELSNNQIDPAKGKKCKCSIGINYFGNLFAWGYERGQSGTELTFENIEELAKKYGFKSKYKMYCSSTKCEFNKDNYCKSGKGTNACKDANKKEDVKLGQLTLADFGLM